MVFFTCNACGASLKKNQVEKHYQNECRNCEVLSCMDCGKDFYGDEYASHTKCISEAEKYQGALFKESGGGGGGVTKGEKKQQEWLERVKQLTATAKVSGRIAALLERIAEYPNVPRKRKKFENFVRNSINVRDANVLTLLWDAFNDATSTKDQPPSVDHNGAVKLACDPPKVESVSLAEMVDRPADHTTGQIIHKSTNRDLRKKKKKSKKCVKDSNPQNNTDIVTTDQPEKTLIVETSRDSSGEIKKKSKKPDPLEKDCINEPTEGVPSKKCKKKSRTSTIIKTEQKKRKHSTHAEEDISIRTKKPKITCYS